MASESEEIRRKACVGLVVSRLLRRASIWQLSTLGAISHVYVITWLGGRYFPEGVIWTRGEILSPTVMIDRHLLKRQGLAHLFSFFF